MKSSLKTVCAFAVCAAAVLAGCGGGQQGERFGAARVLAFGDESSVIDAAGRKYTINALQADTGALDCTANPLWIQTLASSFGLVFRECPGLVADASSRILAVPGAKSTDLAEQIDAFLAEPQSFNGGDLVTVLIGQNDILELYAGYDGSNPGGLVAAAEALGSQVSAQVVRITDRGAKVIVATVPDLGLTPFARGEGPERAALLSNMTRRYNIALLLALPNDGHRIGLVRSDDQVRNLVANPSGLANVTDAACLPGAPLPNCNAATLTTDGNGVAATANRWLWADATHLSPIGHANLASSAVQRAHNNPF